MGGKSRPAGSSQGERGAALRGAAQQPADIHLQVKAGGAPGSSWKVTAGTASLLLRGTREGKGTLLQHPMPGTWEAHSSSQLPNWAALALRLKPA